VTELDEAKKWQRVIRSSVREACETWRIQPQAGPVTSEALEAIVNRAAVPVLALLQELPPEAVVALVRPGDPRGEEPQGGRERDPRRGEGEVMVPTTHSSGAWLAVAEQRPSGDQAPR
jgi:hypothetical protein